VGSNRWRERSGVRAVPERIPSHGARRHVVGEHETPGVGDALVMTAITKIGPWMDRPSFSVITGGSALARRPRSMSLHDVEPRSAWERRAVGLESRGHDEA